MWQGTFAVPAGAWEYKAAIDDSWDENYGVNATPNGANLSLSLAASVDGSVHTALFHFAR